ncbi:hypothetical protein B0H10DRAFT_2242080 [Mycena sp. CBHHK59/15]|nr:hypothetical protein B0H10DRAFT_2242080 [Mycena sp. CBHHK59/15]
MSRRCINLNTHGFMHLPSLPPRKSGSKVPDYVLPGFVHLEYGIEPHIKFRFQTRLREEQNLRDPQQPFPSDPLPDELPNAAAPANRGELAKAAVNVGKHEAVGHGVVTLVSLCLRACEAALNAAVREEQFRKIQVQSLRQRTQVPAVSTRSILRVAAGGAMDLSLIEDRDYDLKEVVIHDTHLTGETFLIDEFFSMSRPVYAADKSLVLFLGGRPHNPLWHRDIVEPATTECDTAPLSLCQSAPEKAADWGPTLTGGVGSTFNEPPIPVPTYGLVLNVLVFFQLFSTLAMKQLVGYGLLEIYCGTAYATLQAQKAELLKLSPASVCVNAASASAWVLNEVHKFPLTPIVFKEHSSQDL